MSRRTPDFCPNSLQTPPGREFQPTFKPPITPVFGNRYWINDPWQYRLPAVYGPYQWVRYYDDVLLVDTYTGEVVDVIHNFFW